MEEKKPLDFYIVSTRFPFFFFFYPFLYFFSSFFVLSTVNKNFNGGAHRGL